LKELDVSDNHFGKDVDEASIKSFITCFNALETLCMARCDIELESLLDALLSNSRLVKDCLSTLDLSGNKMSQKASKRIAEIMEYTSSIKTLVLEKNGLKLKTAEPILMAVKDNKSKLSILLDLSHNGLGTAFTKKFRSLFPDETSCLNGIMLGGNDFGVEGLFQICPTFKNFKHLETLSLDKNVNSGIFLSTKTSDIGACLAKMITELPELKRLSLAGEGNLCLKGGLIPIFKTLETNKSILELNVSGNKFNDETFQALFNLIMNNDTLKLIDADNNKWTLKTFKSLHDAILRNKSLVSPLVVPLNDIASIFQSSTKAREEINIQIHNIEMKLLENIKAENIKTGFESKPSRESWTFSSFDENEAIKSRQVTQALHEMMRLDSTLKFFEGQENKDENHEDIPPPPASEISTQKASAEALSGPRKPLPSIRKTSLSVDTDSKEPTRKSSVTLRGTKSLEGLSTAVPRLSIPEQMPASAEASPRRIHVLAELQVSDSKAKRDVFADCIIASMLPKGVNPDTRENWLLDSEFLSAFGCTREEFSSWAKWKQIRKKRELQLI